MADDDLIALEKKFAEMRERERKILEELQGRMRDDPGFKAAMTRVHDDWVNTLKEKREKKRTLVRTVPWSETTFGELGVELPGMEIELDRENQVTRVYKIS